MHGPFHYSHFTHVKFYLYDQWYTSPRNFIRLHALSHMSHFSNSNSNRYPDCPQKKTLHLPGLYFHHQPELHHLLELPPISSGVTSAFSQFSPSGIKQDLVTDLPNAFEAQQPF